MGLFDELIFEIEDVALERAPGYPYQTKDLECQLVTYYVKPDRRLYRQLPTLRHEAWKKPIEQTFELVDTNYHGDIHFICFDGELSQFTAHFTEGVLQLVKREEE